MPKKNVDYETHVFHQVRQRQGATLDMFQPRLRQLAATCEFENVDREIKAQIVSGCSSSRLRHKALRDPKASLNDLLNHGRALETSESQASGMERQITTEVNRLSLKSSGGKSRPHQHKKTQKNNRCCCYGGGYTHKNGKLAALLTEQNTTTVVSQTIMPDTACHRQRVPVATNRALAASTMKKHWLKQRYSPGVDAGS